MGLSELISYYSNKLLLCNHDKWFPRWYLLTTFLLRIIFNPSTSIWSSVEMVEFAERILRGKCWCRFTLGRFTSRTVWPLRQNVVLFLYWDCTLDNMLAILTLWRLINYPLIFETLQLGTQCISNVCLYYDHSFMGDIKEFVWSFSRMGVRIGLKIFTQGYYERPPMN